MKILVTLFVALGAGMLGVMEQWTELLYNDINPFLLGFWFWFLVAVFCLGLYYVALFIEFLFPDDLTRLEEVR